MRREAVLVIDYMFNIEAYIGLRFTKNKPCCLGPKNGVLGP